MAIMSMKRSAAINRRKLGRWVTTGCPYPANTVGFLGWQEMSIWSRLEQLDLIRRQIANYEDYARHVADCRSGQAKEIAIRCGL